MASMMLRIVCFFILIFDFICFIKFNIPLLNQIESRRFFKYGNELVEQLDLSKSYIAIKELHENASMSSSLQSTTTIARHPNLNNIIIRNARFHDLISIINLRIHVFYPSFKQNYEFQKKLLKKIRERFDKGSTCLIVTANNNNTIQNPFLSSHGSPLLPIGTLEFNSFDFNGTSMESIGATRKLYLADLAIRSEYRRNGIATSLLQNAEIYARNFKYEEIYLHVEAENHIALGLYFRNGYSIYTPTKESIEFTEAHLANSSDLYVMLYKRVF